MLEAFQASRSMFVRMLLLNVLLPDLVTMLTTPPWKLPYSAPAPSPFTWNSSTQSTFGSRKLPPPPGALTVTPSY